MDVLEELACLHIVDDGVAQEVDKGAKTSDESRQSRLLIDDQGKHSYRRVLIAFQRRDWFGIDTGCSQKHFGLGWLAKNQIIVVISASEVT